MTLFFILLLLILSLLFSRFLLRFYCLPCFLLPCLVLTVSARAQRALWPLTRSFALCRPATPPGYLNFYRLCSYQLYFYRLIFTALFLQPYFYGEVVGLGQWEKAWKFMEQWMRETAD